MGSEMCIRDRGSVGSFVLCFLPNIISAGEAPSSLGMFLHAFSARWKFSPVCVHLVNKYFAFFTAASARPFDCGL